jgi:hypothetical protein
MKDIIPPIIHLNGTSGLRLIEGYAAADDAFFEFVEAWGQIEFNPRDYYLRGAEYIKAAQEHREEIGRKIAEIRDYLEAHRISISDQLKIRKR